MRASERWLIGRASDFFVTAIYAVGPDRRLKDDMERDHQAEPEPGETREDPIFPEDDNREEDDAEISTDDDPDAADPFLS